MDFQNYLSFLNELGQTFDKISELERGKIQAVRDGDLDVLNDCIRREQALSLAVRGADQKRERLMRELGLRDVPLRQLPEICPPEYRAETKQVVDSVRQRYEVLANSRKAARTVLECGLHKLENQLKACGIEPELDTRYQTGSGELPPRLRTDFQA